MTQASNIELALALLQSHPGEAADTLEQYPSEAVAAFLRSVPHTLGAPVLEHMLPHYTAGILRVLQSESASLLSGMRAPSIAAALRFVPESLRERLLGELPANRAAACRLLLRYRQDTVGAWMVPQILMLADTDSVEQALTKLSGENAALDSDAVYVVDRQRRLRGVVSTTALLRARPSSQHPLSVSDVMKRRPVTVPARATLRLAQNHAGWQQNDTLPVIGRRAQLVGMLRHVDLRKALGQWENTSPTPATSDEDVFSSLYRTYGRVLFALCDVAGDIAAVGKK